MNCSYICDPAKVSRNWAVGRMPGKAGAPPSKLGRVNGPVRLASRSAAGPCPHLPNVLGLVVAKLFKVELVVAIKVHMVPPKDADQEGEEGL